MSCRHGCDSWNWQPPHGYCGSSIGEPDWYEGGDWQTGRPPRRRRGPVDEERGEASLEARLDDLQVQIARLETLLAGLTPPIRDADERGRNA